MCGQTQHHLSQHISWQKRHANWPMMAMVLPHSTKMHLLHSGIASSHVIRTAHRHSHREDVRPSQHARKGDLSVTLLPRPALMARAVSKNAQLDRVAQKELRGAQPLPSARAGGRQRTTALRHSR